MILLLKIEYARLPVRGSKSPHSIPFHSPTITTPPPPSICPTPVGWLCLLSSSLPSLPFPFFLPVHRQQPTSSQLIIKIPAAASFPSFSTLTLSVVSNALLAFFAALAACFCKTTIGHAGGDVGRSKEQQQIMAEQIIRRERGKAAQKQALILLHSAAALQIPFSSFSPLPSLPFPFLSRSYRSFRVCCCLLPLTCLALPAVDKKRAKSSPHTQPVENSAEMEESRNRFSRGRR